MLFNSLTFLVFLPIVFVIYWFVVNKSLRLQNILLIVASYVFYGWWDYHFLLLIFISTVVDYITGQQINHSHENSVRKRWLTFSLVFNLGLLGVFKYYNFFTNSFVEALHHAGLHIDSWTINIVLPVGISFYTFQTMSYSLDIYQKKLTPVKDFAAFAAFVSFFPQLVAGPIERASNLLPQMLNPRNFSYKQAREGISLMVWGFLKKVVIADSLAPIVNEIFGNYTEQSGGTLILGAIYFGFQIYGDFSGYSDIARGVAKLLGFELMVNFNFPYFSRNIGEFWRRWHISLSTWFRDYVYIPLGGSKVLKWKGIRNVFVIFLVSGFWHGANWTFIAWGLIHAMLFIPSFIRGTNRAYIGSIVENGKYLPSAKTIINMAFTFGMVTLAWVFFRSASLSDAFAYLSSIIHDPLVFTHTGELGFYVLPFVVLEYVGAHFLSKISDRTEWALVVLGLIVIFDRMGAIQASDFIYFQF